MSFSQFLPEPKHQSSGPARAKATASAAAVTAVTAAASATEIPQQGRRKGWVPKTEADFGGGGAYPEIHVLQYPLGMGRKRSAKGNAVAKQVDGSGNISYEALARHGTRESQVVQSTFKELVPLAERVGFSGAVIPARPTAES
ncbi:mRNA splicing protein, partial [Kickxella alabastrina]